MKWGELAEVHAASFFLYNPQGVLFDVRDFLHQPLAVDVAQLRKRCECLLAANRQPIRAWLACGGEGK